MAMRFQILVLIIIDAFEQAGALFGSEHGRMSYDAQCNVGRYAGFRQERHQAQGVGLGELLFKDFAGLQNLDVGE
jgi:hypothetical protein